jgi:HD-like signal output (HDOD) protein
VQLRIWKYSVALALSMRALAELAPPGSRIEPERAYACGLLANVGASFLVWHAGERSRAPFSTAMVDALLQSVVLQHEEVGQLVLASWSLDGEMALVAGSHHASAPPAPPSPYWSLSIVAGELAKQVAPDPTGLRNLHPNVIDRCSSDLRIGTIAVHRMRDSVRSEFESILETMSHS